MCLACIRIKDRFGFVWESNEVTYESMIPEAVPELTLGNTVDVVGEVGDEMGQAPLEVEFDASGSKMLFLMNGICIKIRPIWSEWSYRPRIA